MYVCSTSVSDNRLASSVTSSSEVGPHTVLSGQAAGSLNGLPARKPPAGLPVTVRSDAAADVDNQSRSRTLTCGLPAGDLLLAQRHCTDRCVCQLYHYRHSARCAVRVTFNLIIAQ